MLLAYIFFIISTFGVLGIIFFRRRQFDFLSVYVLILLLYSLPLFGASVYNPYAKNMDDTPLMEVYIIMGIAFLGPLPLLLLNNDFQVKYSILNFDTKIPLLEIKIQLFFLFIFSVIGFVFVVPSLLVATNKLEILEMATNNLFLFVLFEMFPVAGFLLAYILRNKRMLIFFLILIIIITLFGVRRALAMTGIGYLLLINNNSFRLAFRLALLYKYIVCGVVALLLVILSKDLYGYVLFYGLIDGLRLWQENFSAEFLFKGSEFFGTSAILQAVVKSNFEFGSENIFYSLLAIQPIPLSYFGLSSSIFNDAFQPVLFPSITYGMAYNPWAEAYAWLGFVGVIIYALFIPTVLYVLWFLYKRNNSRYNVMLLMLGIVFAFWIQRNSLGSILAYERNILYPLLSIIGLSYFFYKLIRGK